MQHPDIRGLSDWRPLARGGLAAVWAARQISLDRPVAVKVYLSRVDGGDRRRGQQEATAIGRLSGHPGVVAAYDAGLLADGRPFLIMQMCPGGSLTAWLQPENRPTEERVRQVGVRIADALAGAHTSGVLHRDVKPANILLDQYGNPVLADFGLAAVAGLDATSTGALLVTPGYAPPEVFNEQPATESGDVYSLAATLYALLAGHAPRDLPAGPLSREQLVQVANAPVRPLPAVNWHLMDALLAALDNDPDARPTAAGFRDRLTELPGFSAAPRKTPPRAGSGDRPVGRSGRSPRRAAPTASAARDFRATDSRAIRGPGRHRAGRLAVAGVTVLLLASATAWLISGAASSDVPSADRPAVPSAATPSQSTSRTPAITPTSTTTPAAGGLDGGGPEEGASIRLRSVADSAKPFQTVQIQGKYEGGEQTFLRVERRESGRWVAFPIPAKTDASGHFTAYVEFGQPGRYQLRVVDAESETASTPFVLAVR